jgi:uncharacterized membrane protein HdeD (DUF308 family)
MWLKNWGWTIARGVAAILFGLLALTRPGITWVVLMSFFAAYALIDGIGEIVSALSRERPRDRPWGMLFVRGLLGIAVAVLWWAWPVSTSIGFLYVIGTYAILGGLLEIGSAIRLRRIIEHEWRLAFAGLLSVAFGVIVWLRPGIAALALVWWIGAYALVLGVVLVALGFRMHSARQRVTGTPTGALPLNNRLRHQT